MSSFVDAVQKKKEEKGTKEGIGGKSDASGVFGGIPELLYLANDLGGGGPRTMTGRKVTEMKQE